jgi:Zn-dependent M28 family amino/carboxypeptidase
MIRSKASIAAALFLFSTVVAPVCDNSCGGDDSFGQSLLGEISGAEMMSTVVDLQSFGTREFHTAPAQESAMYIQGEMTALGLQTHLQEFYIDETPVVNVVAVLNPSVEAERIFLIGAHYDSENSEVTNLSEAENITAPGADDNGSGVGVMLELARVLSQTTDFPATVKFVAFGAEEMGYDNSGGAKGSAYFASLDVEAGVSYEGVFVLDMVGYRVTTDNRATLVCNAASALLAQSMTEATTEYSVDVSLLTVLDEAFVGSDHASFWEAGYPSILVIEELCPTTGRPVNPDYHTSEDTAEKLSDELMTEVAKSILATIIHLTDQGEDSYSLAYYGVAAATLAAVVTVAAFLLMRKRKEEV